LEIRRKMYPQHLLELVGRYGYLAIFILYTAGIFGLPIPDETLLVVIGFAVKKGTMNYLPAMLSAFFGICVGITINYIIGLTGGAFVLKKFSKRIMFNEAKMKKTSAWFDKYGKWALVIGFCIPGIRHLTAVFAGTTKMKYSQFALYIYLGAFIWVNTFLLLGGIIGAKGFTKVLREHSTLVACVAACALLSALLFWYLKRRSIKRAREKQDN